MLPVSKLLAKGILMLNLKNKVMKFLCRNLIWIMIKIKLVFLVLVLGLEDVVELFESLVLLLLVFFCMVVFFYLPSVV